MCTLLCVTHPLPLEIRIREWLFVLPPSGEAEVGVGQFRNVAGQCSSLSHPVGFAHLRSGVDGHGLCEGISVAEGK